jgi:hypothetical protein
MGWCLGLFTRCCAASSSAAHCSHPVPWHPSHHCHNVPPPTVAVPRCRMRKRINPFMPPRGNFPSPGAPKSPPQCSTPPRPCVVGRKERRRQGGNECRVRSLWRENGYGKGKDGEKGNNKMKGKNKGRNGIKYMKKKEFV